MNIETINYNKAEDLSSALLFRVYEIDYSDFPHPWSFENWNSFFNSHPFLLSLLFIDNKVVGYILYQINIGDSFAHLLKICISKEFRGQKLGVFLMSNSLEYLISRTFSHFYLEVEENNFSAIKIYELLGFKKIHTKKGFYSDGTTALIMTRDLL